ncbi:nucleotidyltransferase family protein [Sulfitobacter sp. D35]|uniref:nucleotidyltransferase family protein n=1 Tax=Sulfitobacter sp. D35 TaxID=3083252 RepID=UPI00296EAA6A|nr:nucleotidyltransferase family protein [Sulfitobacter sp. D35]MDW4498091.1 nucleotidyltransferase family protein [Sulfitobacter sp. D35]
MPDRPDTVMLFAAGFGTRMKPLTERMPKPMIPVAGKPLIDHALALVAPLRPRVVAANLHYRPEPLVAHLAPRGVQPIVETPEILDTGGGLKNALPLLGKGPVITMNTDAIWIGPNPLELLRAAWEPERMDALLICVPAARAVGRIEPGDFTCDAEGRLGRRGDLVYGGAQILKTDRVAARPERVFSLNAIWDEMKAEGRLFGIVHPGHWCDVGTPAGIGLAEDMLRQHDVR